MRRWLPLALLLLLLPVVAGSQTWLRDDTGAVAPPVVFQGSGAAQTRTSALDPLPVTTGATTSTTDPFGWGRTWVGTTTPVISTGFFVDDRSAVGFTGGATLTYLRSDNAGVTWTTLGSVAYFNTAAVTGSLLLPNGRAFLTTGASGGFSAGTCPTTIATGGCTGTTGSAPGGLTTSFLPHLQAGTLIWPASGATGFICRSTDSGASASCTQPAAITGSFVTGQQVASPAEDVWLALDSLERVYRSTDDGVTWTFITALAGTGTTGAIACSSNNVCVAANTLAIHRSTDGGLTWTQVQTTNVNIRGFVVFGRDIIVALKGFLTTTTSVGARSSDNGASWSQLGFPVTAGVDASPQGISTNGAGSAIYLNGNIGYSRAIGAGEAGIVGESGVRWDIDGEGAGGVYQGNSQAGGADNPWQVVPIQRDTLTNSQTTGAANTAVTVTIAAATDQRAHLYKVAARCSAGTSSLTVQYPSGTTRWSTEAAEVTTVNFTERWNPGLTTTANTAMVITLATCGVGNTGTLMVQADRF